MVTLKDVAKDAGVSIATVSCCLSGSRVVKPETKAKVFDSIEKLKYIPNNSARNLKGISSNCIGVILTDIDNLYHAEIFKGISSYLQNENYTLNVAFSNNLPDIECEKIDDFIGQNISGLIIITCQPHNTDFFANSIKHYNIPTVFIERHPVNLDTNFVSFHNYKTLNFIVSRLIEQGYTSIALVSGYEHLSSEEECIKGYEDAFYNHGLSINSELICMTNMTKEDAFKSTMISLGSQKIQAVVTSSVTIAQGVIEALHVQGLHVPDDIKVITLGEESWNNTSKTPGVIHTSRTPFELGVSASKLLLQNINSPILFEKQTITFTDNFVNTEFILPPPAKIESIYPIVSEQRQHLNVLMVDLATSYSTKVISQNFTNQTGIDIHFDFVPQNELLKSIIDDSNRTESKYDIYMYDVPWLDYVVQNMLVADITSFVEGREFDRARIFKQNMDNCYYKDKCYGIPIIGGSQIMFYRKDLFENREIMKRFENKYKISLSPPRTWTEFNGIAEFFTKDYNPYSPVEYGTSFAGIIDEELAPEILIRLWSFGGKLWDRYNNACLNNPENIKAFQNILQTLNYVKQSPFQTSINQTVSDFCSGNTAMLITYTEYASQISNNIKSDISGRVGYKPLPGKTPVSIGWNFGISNFSSKQEIAYQYFNWLCQHDTSYYLTILDGQSTVIDPYHSQELLKLYPWLRLTEKSFEYCKKRVGPYRNNSLVIPQSKIESILCQVLHDILENDMSLQDALNKGQDDLALVFQSYGYPKSLHFI